MLQLETGTAEHLRNTSRTEVDLSAPDGAVPDPDPLFVQTTNWLLCEAGALGLPEIAAATQKPADPLARVALAELARSGPVGETAIAPAARAYYQHLGYEPSIAGALVAVCDLFFGRITPGGVHPAVGAGYIGWYSWMTEDLPDHRVVRACQKASQRWRHTSQPAKVEAEIYAMAAAWQTDHRSHVPLTA